METPDQLNAAIESAEAEVPRETAVNPNAPRMPFPTSLVLTLEQEEKLVEHCLKRKQELEEETGRSRGANGDWWANSNYTGAESLDPLNRDNPARTWMGKRRLYDLMGQNDVDYRKFTTGDSIFRKSNLSVPMTRSVCTKMIARAQSYFFSTDPWFAAYPVGEMDRQFAQRADRYFKWKLDKADLQGTLETAIERGFKIGESVVKSTWIKRVHYYKSREAVMVDETGQPIMDATGEYITKDDQWIVNQVPDPANPEVMIDDTAAVLKRDGVTPKPPTPVFAEMLLSRRNVIYEGNDVKVIHFADFLCPLTAPSIQEADCVIHLYDRDVMEIADEFRRNQIEGINAAESMEQVKQAVEMLQEMAASGNQKHSADSADRAGEDTAGEVTPSAPSARLAEFHLRYDADGDGLTEEICVIVDVGTDRVIFYDYEENVTPDGLRPFSCVRPLKVANRWYGVGAFETWEKSQNIVDLTLNRWAFSQSASGRIDFWDAKKTLEGQSDPDLRLNWGRTYTTAPGVKPDEVLHSVYLEDIKGVELQKFMELFMQMTMNESGVMNANDGQAAGLESSKLATGIRNIERSGQELFAIYLTALTVGVEDALGKNIRLMLGNVDPAEVYRYFEQGEGGEGAGELVTISRADIPLVELDVQVLLTKHHGEQVLASCAQAVELVNQYYAQPYEVQVKTTIFFWDMLKALQIPNPQKFIIPTQVIDPATGLPASGGIPGAGAATGNPSLPAAGATPSVVAKQAAA